MILISPIWKSCLLSCCPILHDLWACSPGPLGDYPDVALRDVFEQALVPSPVMAKEDCDQNDDCEYEG